VRRFQSNATSFRSFCVPQCSTRRIDLSASTILARAQHAWAVRSRNTNPSIIQPPERAGGLFFVLAAGGQQESCPRHEPFRERTGPDAPVGPRELGFTVPCSKTPAEPARSRLGDLADTGCSSRPSRQRCAPPRRLRASGDIEGRWYKCDTAEPGSPHGGGTVGMYPRVSSRLNAVPSDCNCATSSSNIILPELMPCLRDAAQDDLGRIICDRNCCRALSALPRRVDHHHARWWH
jgi:hypothetical protein